MMNLMMMNAHKLTARSHKYSKRMDSGRYSQMLVIARVTIEENTPYSSNL